MSSKEKVKIRKNQLTVIKIMISIFQDDKISVGKKSIDRMQRVLNVQTVRHFTTQSAMIVGVSETCVSVLQDTNRAQHT